MLLSNGAPACRRNSVKGRQCRSKYVIRLAQSRVRLRLALGELRPPASDGVLHHRAAAFFMKLQALSGFRPRSALRRRDHTLAQHSSNSDIDRESSPLLPLNCLLPWARQFASRISTPSANFGTLRESASHIWMGGPAVGPLLQHVGEVLAGMLASGEVQRNLPTLAGGYDAAGDTPVRSSDGSA